MCVLLFTVYSSTLFEKYLMSKQKNFSQLAQVSGYPSCVNLFQRGLLGLKIAS